MQKLLRVLAAVLIAALILAVYLLRFSRNPIRLKAADGKVIFGYDQHLDQWLFNEYQKYELGTDGPYILYGQRDSVTIITTQKGSDTYQERTVLPAAADTFTAVPEAQGLAPIQFQLQSSEVQSAIYDTLPNRLLAISDIEGNLEAFYKLLVANKVIDSLYRWTYGDGHLVLVGDFVDRGNDVLPVLYLIYKLEQEATLAGGRVHYLIGNHEQLLLSGIASYAAPKYLELARQRQQTYKTLFSRRSVLGEWLLKKNCIERIGKYLFVHAGISKEVADMQLGPEAFNSICRPYFDQSASDIQDPKASLLLGREGILWYRGMVRENRRVRVISKGEFNAIANKLGVEKIVVGHSIVQDISTDYDGRLIRIDIHHSSDKPEALMIINGQSMVVDTDGRSRKL